MWWPDQKPMSETQSAQVSMIEDENMSVPGELASPAPATCR